MINLQKNYINKILALLLGILILQQGTGKTESRIAANESFESCVVEILERAYEEDIDIGLSDDLLSRKGHQQHESGSEKDSDETEDEEVKDLIKQQGLATFINNTLILNRKNFFSSLYYTISTPPPEIG
jgi:hypothetical protein